ncbi:O-fucosyltransferase 11 isoform X3 [Ziziphus jujuba]|uniref:O-fucosyltransferase family protein n=1 Tax=Ziziphus jujuba TaxID=326968 RepID=A0ABM4AAL6_ZIZJJ|nr:O-fucosyltransferase 11 isoform X3 [Ziziphus jujuba]
MKTKTHHHNANGYASESSGSNSPSPPPSPRRQYSSFNHSRRRVRSKCQSTLAGGIIFRRKLRYLLVLPLLYVSGLLMCVGPFSALVGLSSPPGSVYRSRETFQRLWPDIQFDNSTAIQLSSVWGHKPQRRLKEQKPCPNSTAQQQQESLGSVGYLIVEANGGLNQQRSAICNAVAVAGLLNAILVIPRFEFHNVWRDPRVIRIAPFANRLAMNVPPHIQHLRCLVNYEALRFSSPISALAKKLVNRMIEKSSRTGGKYVSVHLRFEEDMVAFSCCLYGGGEAEKIEMDSIREKGWRLKFKQKGRVILPGLNRIQGKCPLTPLEVGLMLRGMGFDNNTSIYLASGKIYQAEKHLAPLLKMFPYLHTKESLASSEELAPFEGYSSRLAALDYTVCLFSEIFVTTQGGNFPHFLMGHRRFLYGGHAKTIKPDKRKLVLLLQDKDTSSWKGFKDEMQAMLAESDRKGSIVPRVKKFNRKSSVYTYPFPECRCLQKPQNTGIGSNMHL